MPKLNNISNKPKYTDLQVGTNKKSLAAKIKSFNKSKARKSLKKKFHSSAAHIAIDNGEISKLEEVLRDELNLIDNDIVLLDEYISANLSAETILMDNDFMSSAGILTVKRNLKRKHPKTKSIKASISRAKTKVHNDVFIFKKGISQDMYKLMEDA